MLINNILQWVGAVFIIAGHLLNTLAVDGWNIAAFFVGTVCFLLWTIRVANKPQMAVNVVALATMAVGLLKPWG